MRGTPRQSSCLSYSQLEYTTISMPKRDLLFSQPVMNTAGFLGFAPDSRAPLAWEKLGAFVTNPVSRRPRKPAAAAHALEYPGGFLLHTGLPNPGLTSVLQHYGRRWRDSSVPIIVNLMADRPDETRQMVQALERIENVLAVELGFAPLLAPDIIVLAVEMCMGELPLIVRLTGEQLLEVGGRVLQLGAAALSIGASRGALPGEAGLLTGRMFGAAQLPRSLELVSSAARLGLPIIGGGGVASAADVQAMLTAGALAVQVDAVLWLPGSFLQVDGAAAR